MINWKSIVSSFNERGTLLKWLKKVEQALKESVLTDVTVQQETPELITLCFVFADGTKICSPVITLPKGKDGAPGKDGKSGTEIKIAGIVQDVLNFASDPQQQIDDARSQADYAGGVAESAVDMATGNSTDIQTINDQINNGGFVQTTVQDLTPEQKAQACKNIKTFHYDKAVEAAREIPYVDYDGNVDYALLDYINTANTNTIPVRGECQSIYIPKGFDTIKDSNIKPEERATNKGYVDNLALPYTHQIHAQTNNQVDLFFSVNSNSENAYTGDFSSLVVDMGTELVARELVGKVCSVIDQNIGMTGLARIDVAGADTTGFMAITYEGAGGISVGQVQKNSTDITIIEDTVTNIIPVAPVAMTLPLFDQETAAEMQQQADKPIIATEIKKEPKP